MFNNAMLLPPMWPGEYIWSFQKDVDEYLYDGDTVFREYFSSWRFQRRGRGAVFYYEVSLWASLSEELLALGFRLDTIEGPWDGVSLDNLMASPKGVGTRFYDPEGEPLPVVLDGVDVSRHHPPIVKRRYRFTSGWLGAAFPEEGRLRLHIELGFPARSLYEKTSPS